MKCVIFTVAILREHILFLKEWVEHHAALEFDMVIYDNSKSEVGYHMNMKMDGVSKYGIDWRAETAHLSDAQVDAEIRELQEKFNLKIFEWSPVVNDKVVYGQVDAIFDFVSRFGPAYDFMIHSDIDEFIMLPTLSLQEICVKMREQTITRLQLVYRKFQNRFEWRKESGGLPVSYCTHAFHEMLRGQGEKSFIDLSAFLTDAPRSLKLVHCLPTNGIARFEPTWMYFNHFNYHESRKSSAYQIREENDEQKKFYDSIHRGS